ncbi:MAG: aspartate carbamoyltransferase, partial [Gammaproteobacteria bacterium]|nr:aspartate carbamoyltransferase [Gammaproteobacteria bacterium]
DMYTIFKWRPELSQDEVAPEHRARIGIIGVPARMRTVRSLLIFLSTFAQAFEEVVVIGDTDEMFLEGQREALEAKGLNIRTARSLDGLLPDFDVVYINSIAWVGDSFERLGENLRLDRNSPLKKGAIIMHPLARGDELSTDLDDTPHNWYFAQARGAVFVRMALLTSITQRVHRVMDAPE